MIPILFAPEEKAFDTNGFGVLTDTLDCTVAEVLNSRFELHMVYPVGGIHFEHLRNRVIILSDSDPVREAQPFRVYRITKPINGKVDIYARHICHDLMGITVEPFQAENALLAMQALGENAATDCPFEFTANHTTAGALKAELPQPIWSVMGSGENQILGVFGGEYLFDRFKVELMTRRGMDRGVSLRYGKNISDFEQDEDCSGLYTAVHPFWSDGEGKVVQLQERIVNAPGEHGFLRVLPLDLSGVWEAEPTREQILEHTQLFIQEYGVGIPNTSWTIRFEPLEQSAEYGDTALLERVLLGDTVSVFYEHLGVQATARAVEVRYKPLLERYDAVTLGRVRADLADTILAQKKEILKKPGETQLQLEVKALTGAITGARGGTVRLLDTDNDGGPDTLYIADNPDPNQATKVWRFNHEGWGASKNGYNGPFTMGASFDTGILAEFISAGTLYGMTVKAGYIESESGDIRIDLHSDVEPVFNSGIQTNGLTIRNKNYPNLDLFSVREEEYSEAGLPPIFVMEGNNANGKNVFQVSEGYDNSGKVVGTDIRMCNAADESEVWVASIEGRACYTAKSETARADMSANSTDDAYILLQSSVGSLRIEINKDGVILDLPDGRGAKMLSWETAGDGKYYLVGT